MINILKLCVKVHSLQNTALIKGKKDIRERKRNNTIYPNGTCKPNPYINSILLFYYASAKSFRTLRVCDKVKKKNLVLENVFTSEHELQN